MPKWITLAFASHARVFFAADFTEDVVFSKKARRWVGGATQGVFERTVMCKNRVGQRDIAAKREGGLLYPQPQQPSGTAAG